MNEPTTTDELVAMVKATLRPYGVVHVDQVLAWLQRQADITRAECIEEAILVGDITRCDDCEYCGTNETEYAGLGCTKFNFGSCHKDKPFGDGFCAWAKRKAVKR